MKTFVSFFLFLITILCVNHEVFAQNTFQQGGIIYKVPSGYRQEVSDGMVVLLPQRQSLQNSDFALTITPGIDNAGHISKLLPTLVNHVESGREIIHRQTTDHSSDGRKILSQISISKVDEQIYFTIYLIIKNGSRAEFLAMMTTDADLVETNLNQLKAFFSSVEFVNPNSGNSNSVARNNNSRRSYSNNSGQRSYSNSSASQQAQRNRTYANQVFLNSITNNYNSLSSGIR